MAKPDLKLLEFLPERDMLVVQRRFLIDGHDRNRQEAREHRKSKRGKPPTGQPIAATWPPQRREAADTATKPEPVEPRELPPLLYSFDVVYRYTRGVNDISNPGIGYGEMTRETRWSTKGDTLSKVELSMRRTRTGRQEIDRDPDRNPKR
jgi:hypothetical protein